MSTEIIVNNDIIEINVTEEPIIIEAPSGAYPLPTGVYSVFGRTGVVVAQEGDYTLTLLGDVTISSPSTNQVLRYNGTTWVNATPTNTGTVTSVAATVPTGLTISGSPITTSGTLAFGLQTGYSIPTTISQGTWDTAYNRSLTSASVTGTTTKTLTLNEQGGGTITASWTDINTDAVTSVFGRTGAVVATEGDYTLTQLGDVTITTPANGQVLKYNGTTWVNGTDTDTGLTSVGLSMPSAFTVTNSPLTANGTLSVTGAGTTAQYVRGDGSLATFPSIAQEAQRLITEVYNNSGVTLAKGTVVYINGGQGNLPTVTKAIATGDATSAQTYGIVQTDITNMNNGFVVVIGSLSDLDTQAYAVGTQLYLSSTVAGAWTSVKQYAPAHLVYVAIVVRSHPTQGVVEVRIQNGFEMDELHNVDAQSPSNGSLLQYVSSTSLWTAVAGTTTNISEGTNLYYTDVRARASISLTTTGTSGAATYSSVTGVLNIPQYSGGSGMVYPSAGIALSTGTAWGTSITDNSANWNTAYTNRITSATSPLSITSNVISIAQASTSVSGYLSSTDFTTFNNKANALSGTINTIAYWDSATTISSLALATYPSLTELSYVKGVTSAIQTQLNAKQGTLTLTTTGTSGAATLVGTTLNIPQYSGGGGGMAIGGTITSATAGSVLFAGASGVLDQDNANFFWDDTNNRLGLGSTTLGSKLQINGNAAIGYSASTAAPSNGLLVAGDINISAAGSTQAAPRILGITNWSTAGNSARITFGDTLNSVSSSLNCRLSIQGYWGVEIYGGRQSLTALGFTTGLTSDASLLVGGSVAANPVLLVQGAASQSGSLQQWRNSGGTALSVVTSSGALGILTTNVGSSLQVNGNAAIGYSASTAAPTNGLIVAGRVYFGLGQIGAQTELFQIKSAEATIAIQTTTATSYSGVNLYDAAGALAASFQYGNASAGTLPNTFFFGPRNATASMAFVRGAGATVSATINASGDFGINTTTIGSKLQINGNAAIGYNTSTAAPTNGMSVAGTVNIGTNTSVTTAALQVSSTTQGFLPPVMTTTQKNAITTPAAGLIVYDTTLNKLCVYTTAWETITSL